MRVRGLPYPVMGMGSPLSLARTKGVGYEAESIALFARFTTPPDPTRKALINTLVKSLKAAGVWTKLDALYLFAAADAQAARRNWIQDLYNATAVSSPTFAADRGYTGDGAAAYLDTGFNPSTASSPKLTQNSAHASAWDRTSRAADGTNILGGRQSTTNYIDILPRFTADVMIGRVTTNSAGGLSIANASSVGHFLINRSASNAIQMYKNGASAGSSATASVAVPNVNIGLLARQIAAGGADAYTSDQIAAASIGRSLTSTEAAALYSAINTYLQAVGAA